MATPNLAVNSDYYYDPDLKRVVLGRTARPQGFNAPSPRLELRWIAGARGLPQLNAVTDPPAGDTYSTAGILALLNADREFEILGTNAVSGDVTYSAEGGIKLTTHGGGTDSVILLPHLNSNQSPWTIFTWGTDQETLWEAHIKTGTAITAETIWAGLKLTNTPVTATDDDQCFFRYQNGVNSGKWQAIDSIGGVDTATDSGVTVALSAEYHLKVAIDAARRAQFYINGTRVKTSAALTDATDFKPYIGILEGAATKHMFVFSQAASRKYA